MVWALWWERNKCIFGQDFNSLQTVQDSIQKSVAEVVNNNILNAKCSYLFSSWNGKIIKEWDGLLAPFSSIPNSSQKYPPDHSSTKWIPPSIDFVKLNFDDASQVNLALTFTLAIMVV